jgi:ABC-type sugar transport system ATPase subunit
VSAADPRRGGADDASATPILALDGASKSYGAVRAVRNASLALRPAEVRALVGENGAGKSSIVRLLAGASSSTAGPSSCTALPTRATRASPSSTRSRRSSPTSPWRRT